MNRIISLVVSISTIFAVVIQYKLMLSNSVQPVFETNIRFFSYFTILTNSLVAAYFTNLAYSFFKAKEEHHYRFSTLTAITVYITIVGLVYQIILRQTWHPEGMQKIVDEMLHSINPLLVILFWFLNSKGKSLKYNQLWKWLIYPLVYLGFVLIRGHFSNFYPYPFLNLTTLNPKSIAINCLLMTFLFILISLIYIWTTKQRNKVILNKTN
ncbi:MAG: Pr6Pr family membrane protein [Bacteroidetes bacterium]|nr:Pr6Pr family membrane protein [Bacteroidota bacterium]MBS1631243.1 Pr6Pr family membrane protein [Bacteroidota bacterium]